MPGWVAFAGAVVIGLIIADGTPGVLGHVFALVVWGFAAWACLPPARSKVVSAARTLARIGVAAFAALAVYAGGLAVVSGISGSDNYCLLSVSDNAYGGSGVLAVPQANATQSVCDSVASSTQQSFDQGTNNTGSIFVITGGKPGYVTPCQQDHMTLFGTGNELPGWLVYSGTVGGIHAGGDGTTC